MVYDSITGAPETPTHPKPRTMTTTKKRWKTEAERNEWELARARRMCAEERAEREARAARTRELLKTCWWSDKSLLED